MRSLRYIEVERVDECDVDPTPDDYSSDEMLQELTDALSQEELDELNAEMDGRYDPEPIPRWPRG